MIAQDSSRRLRTITKAYYIAKGIVLRQGYAEEVDWQYAVSLQDLNESAFLREAGWVIISSGISETVVRQKFPSLSAAFFDWASAERIVENVEACRTRALSCFGHAGKVDAIIKVASHVERHGFEKVLQSIEEQGPTYLRQFPYIGPITSYHLAKNIGLPFAKPDRHLSRVAEKLGYGDVQKLCADIAAATDEPIPVIDIVLWRYTKLRERSVARFANLLMEANKSRLPQAISAAPPLTWLL